MSLHPAEWRRGSPIEDGSAVRIHADLGACPLVRVDVDDREAAVAITLYERVPDKAVAVLAIGISVTFDVALPTPLGRRALVDGATGRPARPLGKVRPGTPPRLPVGCEFAWEEITGQPWWEPAPESRGSSRPGKNASAVFKSGPET